MLTAKLSVPSMSWSKSRALKTYCSCILSG